MLPAVILSVALASSVSAQRLRARQSTVEEVTKEGCTARLVGNDIDHYSCEDGGRCDFFEATQEWLCTDGEGHLQDAAGLELHSHDGGAETHDHEEDVHASETVTKAGCTPHGDHYDCDDGGYCEEMAGEWVCYNGQGEEQTADGTLISEEEEHGHDHDESAEAETSSSSSAECVLHGGHTHGDCSDSCAGVDTGGYNLDLRIAAVFVLLIGSAVGILTPMLFGTFLHKKPVANVFFCLRQVGTGIIIALAFVHLLYHSFVMFNNACLGELAFAPAAAAIALAALLVVFVVDVLGHRYGREHQHKHMKVGASQESIASQTKDQVDASSVEEVHQVSPFDVHLLEAGIIFHSVMIGVALGAAGDSSWVPLFCAIIFHQLFEGFALGSRIVQCAHRLSFWHRAVLAAFFIVITPVGIAIGIGVHSSWNVNGRSSLLSVGILDAISAGLLIYIGIADLLVEDWMHGEARNASKSKMAAGIASLTFGLFLMTLLGKWA